MTEGVSSTSWGDTPTQSLIRVRPDQVTHWALLWDLLNAILLSNLVDVVDTWGETTVEAKHLLVNKGSQWQVVEELGEDLPHVSITILSQAFVIKSIHLRDSACLVVSSEDMDTGWVADLVCDQKGHGLDRVVTTIDVVTHEEVVIIWNIASNFEKLDQVMELTVNISTDGDWRLHLSHIRFTDQNFLSSFGQVVYFCFWEWGAANKGSNLLVQFHALDLVQFLHGHRS